MDRRTLLKTGTMGFLGLGLGGCATGSGREDSLLLAPVAISRFRRAAGLLGSIASARR